MKISITKLTFNKLIFYFTIYFLFLNFKKKFSYVISFIYESIKKIFEIKKIYKMTYILLQSTIIHGRRKHRFP